MKTTNKKVIYIHGKGGAAEEAAHYAPLFADCAVSGFDYRAQTPWEAKKEFPEYFREAKKGCESVILVANSIGAFFSLSSLDETVIERAYFISPVVDMERLILDMMTRAGVTESELKEKGEIPTSFGETLSWRYLCYVRENPIEWHVPTHILYGEHDCLTPRETISDFARKHSAALSVMPGGEHWFHTEEEMRFLDEWIAHSYSISRTAN